VLDYTKVYISVEGSAACLVERGRGKVEGKVDGGAGTGPVLIMGGDGDVLILSRLRWLPFKILCPFSSAP